MSAACPVCAATDVDRLREITLGEFLKELTGLADGSDELRRIVLATEREIGAAGYVIRGCRSCGLEFADPLRQPGGRWYAEIYGRYRPNAYPDRWEFEEVATWVEAGQTLLELGCGDGRFLARVRERGAEGVGVDPNPEALSAARRLGLTVHETLEEVRGAFDWVCMFHTLEHLPDPRAAVTAARSRCAENGRLAVSVPSPFSYVKFIWGPSVLSMPPHHMTTWSERSMRGLLCAAGLVEERLVFEPLPRELFRRRYAEKLVGRGPLSPILASPRGKGLAVRLARVLLRRRLEAAARGLTGRSMLAIYGRPAAGGTRPAAPAGGKTR